MNEEHSHGQGEDCLLADVKRLWGRPSLSAGHQVAFDRQLQTRIANQRQASAFRWGRPLLLATMGFAAVMVGIIFDAWYTKRDPHHLDTRIAQSVTLPPALLSPEPPAPTASKDWLAHVVDPESPEAFIGELGNDYQALANALAPSEPLVYGADTSPL